MILDVRYSFTDHPFQLNRGTNKLQSVINPTTSISVGSSTIAIKHVDNSTIWISGKIGFSYALDDINLFSSLSIPSMSIYHMSMDCRAISYNVIADMFRVSHVESITKDTVVFKIFISGETYYTTLTKNINLKTREFKRVVKEDHPILYLINSSIVTPIIKLRKVEVL